MDNIRLVLLFALAFVILLIYQAWMKDYGEASAPEPQTSQTTVAPQTEKDSLSVPDVNVQIDKPAASAAPIQQVGGSKLIAVETDVLKVEISTLGGTVERVWLLDYPVSPEKPEVKFQLLNPDMTDLYVAQSGLIGTDKGALPTHQSQFVSKVGEYRLAKDQESLAVELTWTSDTGVQVTKRYRFKRGSYLVDLEQEVSNDSETLLPVRSYYQLLRSEPLKDNDSRFIHTYTGAAYYTPEDKYEKVSFKKITEQKLDREVTGGWVAMLQHYFVSAWIPPSDQDQTFFTKELSGPRYVIGGYTPAVSVEPGTTHEFNARFYTGPKLQNRLAAIAPGLDLTVDYGWLTVLAKPIWWVLNHLHALVGNWGWAIILLTVLIKAAFFKLSETSYKSMANMRKLTPRLQAMKDRYGDDKQRLNQAMMDLYKKEKVNPLGGCLPIVIQIPVFIALYWVLLESVEMRQAPFALWIQNLSAPDPYYILPLIMGVSMFVQQKLNPAPVDPLQAKIMLSLPIVFSVFFAFFPSGLVLYWTVNNVLSIAQQWHITRKIEAAANSK